MVTTIPNTQDVVSDEVLDNLSMGALQAIQLRIIQRQHEKIQDSNAYHDFARHGLDTGADWGTRWAAERPATAEHPGETLAYGSFDRHSGPTPVPPEDYYNTLPGMVDNLVTARRVQDALVASLTGIADRAYDLDRDTMLGIPASVNMFKTGKRWLADRFQIDARQMGKYYARAELITAEHTTIAGIGKDPLLPKMAEAYSAGDIPSENMDRMTQIAKQFYDFYHEVGLTKDNATEILQTMDPVFTDAAQRMTSQQLAEESGKWLNQIAHIVDPDGPPPQDRLTKVTNTLHTRIVGGKLHINIVTDVLNLELIEALILAGLNFKANQDKFRSDDAQNNSNTKHDAAEEPPRTHNGGPAKKSSDPAVTPPSKSSGEHTPDADTGSSDAKPTDDEAGLFDDIDLGGPTPYDGDTSAEERLKLFGQRMDTAINDPETFVETEDGQPVSRDELRRLDSRSRAEKAHDIFMTMLKAQGKRSPGAEGMPEYKRAPAILWTVMDYETLIRMQQDRIEPNYHLDPRHQRLPGLDGFNLGPPTSLAPLGAIVNEHLPDDEVDAETFFGSDPLLHRRRSQERDHDPPEGHRYVSHRFQTGSVSPAAVLQDLCDAKIVPAIFNQAGVPLFLGRGKRVFSDDQILAAGMLGGCRGPGCRVPPVWTEGHHGRHWLHNGGTNTTNLILLCNGCHTRVHQGVWTPTWNNEGTLYWIPAPWLDPSQTPIRNTYWDA